MSRQKTLSRVPTLLLLCLCAWLAAVPGHSAEDAAYSEDEIKAAYLHRFAAYVEWPPEAAPASSFDIGVVGADAVLAQLRRLLPAINVRGRAAHARAIETAGDLNGVAILYIAPGQLAAARRLIVAARSAPVLIVTDDPAGLAAGAVVNFIRVGKNVRFEVSQPAAHRAGLKIDPALLAVAARVETR